MVADLISASSAVLLTMQELLSLPKLLQKNRMGVFDSLSIKFQWPKTAFW